ncbi:MAG: glycerol-3-phosphate dehydrogenase C-terminal domain-containing protein, partial [Candidatus Nanopelagicaceae bacterium]
AQSISDVLERRTRIWFEAPNFGVDFVNATADLIAPYLNWKAADKKASVKDYLEKVASAEKSVAHLAN